MVGGIECKGGGFECKGLSSGGGVIIWDSFIFWISLLISLNQSSLPCKSRWFSVRSPESSELSFLIESWISLRLFR